MGLARGLSGALLVPLVSGWSDRVRRERLLVASVMPRALRRIPGTATVTAVSRLEVRILTRDEFLAAVTGNPESAQSADEVVSTRLNVG